MKIRVNEEYVQEEINALELRITGKVMSSYHHSPVVLDQHEQQLR
jgi:hypothetical protein